MKKTETVVEVKKVGKLLGIRLPLIVVRAAGLHVNQKVRVSVEDGRVVITPAEASPTLEDRLAKFDAVRHGGEVRLSL